mmetsp:Transcript_19089/g.44198  ORF Transcript_19089/g.44198 Transcript_19089/m.44198 type:complete len:84 (-) Transcript_19089:62-313(-)
MRLDAPSLGLMPAYPYRITLTASFADTSSSRKEKSACAHGLPCLPLPCFALPCLASFRRSSTSDHTVGFVAVNARALYCTALH